MKPHLIATLPDPKQAEEAFHQLKNWVKQEDISFIHKPEEEKSPTEDASADSIGDGVTWGSAIGGVVGLTVGMSTLLVPGIGPIMAAGPIYAALAGVTTGGILGGLLDLGINRYTAEKIEEHLQSGNIVITVEIPDESFRSQIINTLKNNGAIDIHEELVKP